MVVDQLVHHLGLTRVNGKQNPAPHVFLGLSTFFVGVWMSIGMERIQIYDSLLSKNKHVASFAPLRVVVDTGHAPLAASHHGDC